MTVEKDTSQTFASSSVVGVSSQDGGRLGEGLGPGTSSDTVGTPSCPLPERGGLTSPESPGPTHSYLPSSEVEEGPRTSREHYLDTHFVS